MILGASGSGKSTFLNIISGLESPDRGTVSYDGTDITALSDEKLTAFRKEHIGFIFQQYYLLPDMNVEQNVKMGADLAHNKDYKSVIQAVGLGDKLHKYPSQLSGGQQQRVSVARALAKKPKVLFLDEPTRELDESTGRQVLDYICKLKDQYGFTIVMVTHNLNIAEMAKTVIRMNSGKISQGKRTHSSQYLSLFCGIAHLLFCGAFHWLCLVQTAHTGTVAFEGQPARYHQSPQTQT